MKRFLLLVWLALPFGLLAQQEKVIGSQQPILVSTTEGLTGVWKGYAYHQNYMGSVMTSSDKIKYELQVAEKNGKTQGICYSYLVKQFYGKTTLEGTYDAKTKMYNFREDKLIEWTTENGSGVCLFTCKLEYSKEGDDEYLIGTYTSKSMENGSNCGGGKIYLTKVPKSEFYKEPFVKKREEELAKEKPQQKPAPGTKPIVQAKPKEKPAPKPTVAQNKPKPAPKPTIKKPEKTVVEPVAKTRPKDAAITKNNSNASINTKKDSTPTVKVAVLPPKPNDLKRRDNELVKSITSSAAEIRVELYDNGEIDGDTITVYHNNQKIINAQRLTDKPIVISLKNDPANPHHELVMVANNLGEIPPNTALMIVKAGGERYEVRLVSNEQKNAMVVFDYKQK
jgi:hypothetical protein